MTDPILEEAKNVTDRTDRVCGSTSLPEYRQHMNALEEVRDAVVTLENDLKKRKSQEELDRETAVGMFTEKINVTSAELREVQRWKKKIDDHWERSKAQSNDVRFNRPADSTPRAV
jgi:predicted SnoaL-like aldol condensation-catalyzing enzyme